MRHHRSDWIWLCQWDFYPKFRPPQWCLLVYNPHEYFTCNNYLVVRRGAVRSYVEFPKRLIDQPSWNWSYQISQGTGAPPRICQRILWSHISFPRIFFVYPPASEIWNGRSEWSMHHSYPFFPFYFQGQSWMNIWKMGKHGKIGFADISV